MRMVRLLMMALASLFLLGCAPEPMEIPLVPTWVDQGSGFFSAEGTTGIQGVGISAGITDNDLAAKVADRLAQQAIDPHLESLKKEMAREYSKVNETRKGAGGGQDIDEDLTRFAEAAKKYVRTVDHWRNPDTRSYYSLARLDLEGMTAGLNQLEDLDGGARAFIHDHLRPALEKLLAGKKL